MIKKLILNEIKKLISRPVAQLDRATAFKFGADTQNNINPIRLIDVPRIMCVLKDAISENPLKVIPRKLTYSRIYRDHTHPSWNAKEMVQAMMKCLLSSRFQVRVSAG